MPHLSKLKPNATRERAETKESEARCQDSMKWIGRKHDQSDEKRAGESAQRRSSSSPELRRLGDQAWIQRDRDEDKAGERRARGGDADEEVVPGCIRCQSG